MWPGEGDYPLLYISPVFSPPATVISNEPMEDDHSEAIIPTVDSCWSLFAVIDGHSGWETSAVLREELIKSVAIELSKTNSGTSATAGNDDPYDEAIIRAFQEVDDRIVHGKLEQVFKSSSRSAAINLLAPAYAGACAVLAFYDSRSSTLRIGLTGDCRAILGRRQPDGKYTVEILTTDQTAYDPSEKARLEAAHPGEAVVKDGRTMGYGPSRAFGDAVLKWSREVQTKLQQKFLGRSPPGSLKTPPYFTAEPVVTKVEGIQDDDFVVLATDGLWECLTNEEVIGLVGRWVQETGADSSSKGVLVNDCSLPVIKPTIPYTAKGRNAQSPSPDGVRYNHWYSQWVPVKKQFITVDSNAATHLIRNALGGADNDLREALLSMGNPRARQYRDDITATVVFFGKS
ncbi:protein serine/threonine phosphatase 2C [Hysterangium stoloniferum]|nr:protein serine/threonine phosphatase 2C [Hysterangium stoloniferum]